MTGKDCPRYREMMVERIAGELRAVATAELDQHLRECEACAHELASLSEVVDRLDAAAQTLPPPPEWLVTRAMSRAQSPWSGWLGRSALAGAAAAAVFTLLLGWQAGAPGVRRAPHNSAATRSEFAPQSQIAPQAKAAEPGQAPPQAKSAPRVEPRPQADPAPQSRVSTMMAGREGDQAARLMDASGPAASVGAGTATDWSVVFSGTPQAAEEAAAKLDKAGIPHRSRFLAADSTIVVTVASQDWERANEAVNTPSPTP